jgi:hypothetical protein
MKCQNILWPTYVTCIGKLQSIKTSSVRVTEINVVRHNQLARMGWRMYSKLWLVDSLFTVLRPAQEFFTFMETSGLQNLDLCSALRAFEQGGIFIVPQLLWHGASVFPCAPSSRLLRDTRRGGGPILTRKWWPFHLCMITLFKLFFGFTVYIATGNFNLMPV